MPSIRKGDIECLPLNIPSQAEQKEIADRLDILLAQVEATRARLAHIPDNIKQFRQSVLAAAVSGKLTEDWRELNKGVERWRLVELKEAAEIIDPHPSHRTPKAVDGGVPYIGIGDLKLDGSIDFENSRKVSFDVLKEHNERYTLKAGDFIFGKIGTLGKATILPIGIDYTLSANVILIQPIEHVATPEYLQYFLSSPSTLNEIAKQANSTSQAAFGIKKMRTFQCKLPNKEEQNEIVRRVEQLFAYADSIEQQAKAAKERVDKLTQAILAKAFRGELTADWRAANPDLISGDNSAAALLARIQAERATVKPRKSRRV
ncbi:restriction endonuclease subunit S [Aeromonas caviae]|uniref:restriction endonuclease subunit S n=1 Tax=Aeromonas caviae TaxID=648 RepID=UPI0038CFC7E5